MKRVVIGLSGGVDSSVAAYLLKQQGYDVVGLFMINWHDTTGTLEGDCPWHDDRLFAELVARRLDIPLHVTDLSAEYRRRVVDYMFSEYERGRTPNPDVLCNREIKFDVFMKEAFRLGADYVATGHYCRKAEEVRADGGTTWRLLAGSDPGKDQSYFLCQLSQEQLRPALFPVGGLLKPEVRRIAAEQGLATAKRKDSQGICFVGKVDLPLFLQQKLAARRGNVHEIRAEWPKYAGRPTPPAPGTEPTTEQLAALAEPWHYTVRDGKKIGEHNGAHFYTIGQRKGLGFGGGPWFVVKKNIKRNILFVSHGYDPELVYKKRIKMNDFHFITENPWHSAEEGDVHDITFKIRHTPEFLTGKMSMRDGAWHIDADEKVHGVAPGQFCVVYDSDHHLCYGSGEID